MSNRKQCPLCKEDIHVDATRCKHCHARLPEGTGFEGTNDFASAPTIMPDSGLEVDLLFADRYKIKRRLGSGGMGSVWLARDQEFDREVAVKVLPPMLSGDPQAAKALKNEASLSIDLLHKNICRVFHFDQVDQTPYLVLEYIDGESLAEVLARRGKLHESEAIIWLEGICKALDIAHKNRVIHRDLKPANVMITKDDVVKVCDFGIASIARNTMSRLSGDIARSGTLVYMSPEQVQGSEIKAPSDIYSLGCLMHEVLSGNPPFSSGDISYQHVNKESELLETVSPVLAKAILKSLNKSPGDRFASAMEFYEAASAKPKPRLVPEPKPEPAPEKRSSTTVREKENLVGKNKSLIYKTFWGVLAIGIIAVLAMEGVFPFGNEHNKEPEQKVVIQKEPEQKVVIYKEHSRLVKMVEIPAGSFQMGSPSSESSRNGNETQHKVTISKPFLMSETVVTQKQWQAVMGNNPSEFDGNDNPVEQVNWYDCVKFCNKLSEKYGLAPVYKISDGNVTWDKNKKGYRLPTEAEWEYACRAGTTTRFNTGDSDSDLEKAAWIGDISDDETNPVAQKTPNNWGLYDMHGNVMEWCWDWQADYSMGSVTDPRGSSSGIVRILRGGSWGNKSMAGRSANRFWGYPESPVDDWGGSLGFRLALDQ